jgi:hypothetical protein
LVRKPEAKVSLWGTVVILENIKVGFKVRRQAFMKMIMNLQVSETLEILSLTERLLASEEGLVHVAI